MHFGASLNYWSLRTLWDFYLFIFSTACEIHETVGWNPLCFKAWFPLKPMTWLLYNWDKWTWSHKVTSMETYYLSITFLEHYKSPENALRSMEYYQLHTFHSQVKKKHAVQQIGYKTNFVLFNCVYSTISINCLHLESYPSPAYCQQLPAITSPSHAPQNPLKLEYLLMMASSPTTVNKIKFLSRVLGTKVNNQHPYRTLSNPGCELSFCNDFHARIDEITGKVREYSMS